MPRNEGRMIIYRPILLYVIILFFMVVFIIGYKHIPKTANILANHSYYWQNNTIYSPASCSFTYLTWPYVLLQKISYGLKGNTCYWLIMPCRILPHIGISFIQKSWYLFGNTVIHNKASLYFGFYINDFMYISLFNPLEHIFKQILAPSSKQFLLPQHTIHPPPFLYTREGLFMCVITHWVST